jgi:hypothetical protein
MIRVPGTTLKTSSHSHNNSPRLKIRHTGTCGKSKNYRVRVEKPLKEKQALENFVK